MAARWIDVPEELLRPSLVQLAGALPAPEIVLARQVPFIHSDRHSQRCCVSGQVDDTSFSSRREPAHTELCIILVELASRLIGKPNPQGIEREARSRC